MNKINLEDVDIHIIDQRIGAGIGGFDTRMRFYHKPTQTLIEAQGRGGWKTREVGLLALELILEELR